MPKAILFFIIVLIIAAAGFWYYSQQPQPQSLEPQGAVHEGQEEAALEGQQAKEIVLIKDFAFNPSELVIQSGTEITWRNDDAAPHTATAQGAFDSGTLMTGDTFSYTFDSPGTFDYICTIHPFMKGRIVVE